LPIEPAWSETYGSLATELDLPAKDLAEAVARVQALIDRIDAERPDDSSQR
jgi:hypothetical protein